MGDWGRHEYGKLYEAWPKTDAGEPEQPVFLTHCSPLDMDTQLVQNMLEAFGIPTVRVLPGQGAFGQLILGMSGEGTDLYVPASLEADARALLEAEPEEESDEL